MNENEGVHVRDARHCLLCGCKGVILYSSLRDRLFGAPGNWNLMQCSKCNLAWLNPQPTAEDVGKLYADYFTHQNLGTQKVFLAGLRMQVRSSILKCSFGYPFTSANKTAGSILSRIPPIRDIAGGSVMWLKCSENAHLLDVGCGNGSFLVQMRQLGWDVTGIEPDKDAVSVARQKHRLNVFNGSLDDHKFPDKHFDAITLNHVIEHAIDPMGLLMECRRILKPGGQLVLVTPNIKSLARRMFNDSWLHWDPPRHLHLFSLQALRVAAYRAGLIIKELRTTAKGARWIWVSSSIIKRDGILNSSTPIAPGLPLRLQGLAFQMAEHASRSEYGEELVLTATR